MVVAWCEVINWWRLTVVLWRGLNGSRLVVDFWGGLKGQDWLMTGDVDKIGWVWQLAGVVV